MFASIFITITSTPAFIILAQNLRIKQFITDILKYLFPSA